MMQNMLKMTEGMTINNKPVSQASEAEIEAWSQRMQRHAPAGK